MRCLALAALAVVGAFPVAHALTPVRNPNDPLAFVEKAEGPVRVLAPGGAVAVEQLPGPPPGQLASAPNKITPDYPLPLGSIVETGPEGRAALRFFEGPNNRIKLGARARLYIEHGKSMSMGEPDRQKSTILELKQGEADIEVNGKYGPGESFDVKTPNGVAGVRGTAFVIGYDVSTTRLGVRTGRVELKGRADAAALAVEAGQSATIGADGKARLAKAKTPPQSPSTKTSLK